MRRTWTALRWTPQCLPLDRGPSPWLKVQALTGAFAPNPILAEGQHRVGDVVLGTDGVEHLRNVERLLIEICL